MNPYDTLGVTAQAGDDEIRRAYLALVRQYPPEQEPERFQEISGAYALIKDQKARLRYYLWNKRQPVERLWQALPEHFRKVEERRPPAFEEMMSLLRSMAQE